MSRNTAYHHLKEYFQDAERHRLKSEQYKFLAMKEASESKATWHGLRVIGHLRQELNLLGSDTMSFLCEAATFDRLKNTDERNLAEMVNRHDHARKISTLSFLQYWYQVIRTKSAWQKIKEEKDLDQKHAVFKSSLEPRMQALVNAQRDIAQAKAMALGLSPYDALLDQYSPGLRDAQLQIWFDDLGKKLPPMLNRIKQRQAKLTQPDLHKVFEKEKLNCICHDIPEKLGMDLSRSSLSETPHAFCIGSNKHVWLGYDIHPNHVINTLNTIIHETGHALYQQNLPTEWHLDAVGQKRSAGIDEACAMVYEFHVGQNESYLQWLSDYLVKNLKADSKLFSLENLCRYHKKIHDSPRRIDSDEASYPLHIMLRWQIEKDLISGDLNVRDLPERWAADIQSFLGLDTNPSEYHCVDDMHWCVGLYGYYPAYMIGIIAAAQIFNAFKKDNKDDVFHEFSLGKPKTILNWMNKHIYMKGSLFSEEEIFISATGRSLDTTDFIRHIEARYL